METRWVVNFKSISNLLSYFCSDEITRAPTRVCFQIKTQNALRFLRTNEDIRSFPKQLDHSLEIGYV